MARLTPQQVIDREMEKLKSMGITMNVQLAPSGESPRVMSVLKEAAKGHGIHYGEPDDEVPHLDEGKNQSFPHTAPSSPVAGSHGTGRSAGGRTHAPSTTGPMKR